MKFLSKALIVGAVVLASGAFGYIYQTGFFDVMLVLGNHHDRQSDKVLKHAMTPVSEADYRRKTAHGWSTGCAIGLVLGLLLVVRLSYDGKKSA